MPPSRRITRVIMTNLCRMVIIQGIMGVILGAAMVFIRIIRRGVIMAGGGRGVAGGGILIVITGTDRETLLGTDLAGVLTAGLIKGGRLAVVNLSE